MVVTRDQKVPDELVQEVCERYKTVRAGFASRYLTWWFGRVNAGFSSVDEILALPPPYPLWFKYALSSNARGARLFDIIKPYLRVETGRSLDVGCGYGGFVVAFARQGFEATGVDLDENRLRLSEANCSDWGLSGRIHRVDILEENLPDRLGRFDVITCNDVIEHVDGARRAISNLVALLRPGGILVMEIPNKHSIEFVSRDGHFEVFGITLLERARAVRYHSHFDGGDYTVGEYYPLNTYCEWLEEAGCQAEVLRLHAQKIRRAPRMLARALRRYLHFSRHEAATLPRDLRADLNRLFLGYLGRFSFGALTSVLRGRAGFATFGQTYLDDFWTLIATTEDNRG